MTVPANLSAQALYRGRFSGARLRRAPGPPAHTNWFRARRQGRRCPRRSSATAQAAEMPRTRLRRRSPSWDCSAALPVQGETRGPPDGRAARAERQGGAIDSGWPRRARSARRERPEKTACDLGDDVERRHSEQERLQSGQRHDRSCRRHLHAEGRSHASGRRESTAAARDGHDARPRAHRADGKCAADLSSGSNSYNCVSSGPGGLERVTGTQGFPPRGFREVIAGRGVADGARRVDDDRRVGAPARTHGGDRVAALRADARDQQRHRAARARARARSRPDRSRRPPGPAGRSGSTVPGPAARRARRGRARLPHRPAAGPAGRRRPGCWCGTAGRRPCPGAADKVPPNRSP